MKKLIFLTSLLITSLSSAQVEITGLKAFLSPPSQEILDKAGVPRGASFMMDILTLYPDDFEKSAEGVQKILSGELKFDFSYMACVECEMQTVQKSQVAIHQILAYRADGMNANICDLDDPRFDVFDFYCESKESEGN